MAKTLKQRLSMIFGSRKRHEKKHLRRIQYEIRRQQLTAQLLHCTESGVTDQLYDGQRLVVSLTSFGKRLRDVGVTIASIMEQTVKANKIVLWLEEELQDRELPMTLELLKKRGLEVRYYRNVRSYLKIIPSLREYPDDIIVTIDDDHIYAYDLLELLMAAHRRNPDAIVCQRMHRMVLSKSDLRPLPYHRWEHKVTDTRESRLNFPLGVGGVLYPPHSLDDEVLAEDVFTAICPHADDIWLKAMSLKKGTRSLRLGEEADGSLINEDVQDVGLSRINTHGRDLNNEQLRAVFDKYGLYRLLSED